MAMTSWEKRQQDLIRKDLEIEDMADREGERIVVLEVEMRHMNSAIASMAVGQERMRAQIEQLETVLTKASGVKLAFMVFVGGLGFAVSQFWNFVGWAK